MGGASRQRGVAYLALLLAIALTAGVLAASAQVWSTVQRREREAQLLWAGDQYRRALAAYAAGGDGRYPQQLQDLLEDPRSAAKRRHLRRLYEDPMTRQADWALLLDHRGGIVGVHSRSEAAPLKTGRFVNAQADFTNSTRYADWVFVAAPNFEKPRRAIAAAAPLRPAPAVSAPATTPDRHETPAPPPETTSETPPETDDQN